MDKVINIINLLGWSFLVLKVGFSVFLDPLQYLNNDISLDLNVLRVMQLFQIFDIMLIMIGKSKGSITGSFFQVLGRNIVTLVFMSAQSHRLKFAAVLIIYSIADANRYLYYVFKSNPLAGLLRYNSFLILYPLGLMGQLLIINDYISRNNDFTDIQIYLCRGAQLIYIIGIIAIYKYMLKSRSKYMKTLNSDNQQIKENNEQNNAEKVQQSSSRQIKRE